MAAYTADQLEDYGFPNWKNLIAVFLDGTSACQKNVTNYFRNYYPLPGRNVNLVPL
jgi:hypothetical protein